MRLVFGVDHNGVGTDTNSTLLDTFQCQHYCFCNTYKLYIGSNSNTKVEAVSGAGISDVGTNTISTLTSISTSIVVVVTYVPIHSPLLNLFLVLTK